jgi:peptidoglycan/xylan/chitin deacetylase (PgdA/CDA1 family)
MMFGSTGAQSLSRGEFGATTGVPRLLELFERLDIATTWFIPGISALQFPEAVASVAARGHEIGNHGHFHEDFAKLSPDEARSAILRANDALLHTTGKQPVGIRLSGSDVDGRCLEIIAEEGFLYDSSLGGGYRARWARARDTFDEDRILHYGTPLDLVELPFDYSVTDFSNFEISGSLRFPSAMPNPRQVEEVWVDELHYLAEHEPDGFLMVTIHPQVIGRGARMAMLERVIDNAQQLGFRFATAEAIAREFRVLENRDPERHIIAHG